MVALLALLAAGLCNASPIVRDAYGVPQILAPTWEEAFFHAGYAVAEDRLWQMEMNRRIGAGRLSELLGPEYLAADRETLRTAYTPEELDRQFQSLSSRSREAFESYAKGVNAYMEKAAREGTLPPGYQGTKPEPWTVRDSVAIAVRLFRLFGRGGAGELRNLAALTYLQTQPCRERALDVLDDLAWQNDPEAPTTVDPADDLPADKRPSFPKFSRADTEAQLAKLPKLNLLELLPALRLAERAEGASVAERLGLPSRTGSYAIVVAPKRSATGVPLLVAGPQMGFSRPSVVHEMSISAPGIAVAGMDVPGVPGVLVGHTLKLAWALTTSVADTEDVVFLEGSGPDAYRYGGSSRKLERLAFQLRPKGAAPETVVQERSHLGPILLSLRNGQARFALRSSFWMSELESYDTLIGLYNASSANEVLRLAPKATMGFNLLFATTSGDIGFAYLGRVPLRAERLDPRLPTPGSPDTEWRGVLPFDRMPQVVNPASGLLTNWNNKPAAWWPNLDTPVWGRVDRVDLIREALGRDKLSLWDLEAALWTIARRSEVYARRQPLWRAALVGFSGSPLEADAARYLTAFDGWMVEGNPAAAIFQAANDELVSLLLEPHVGSLLGSENLRRVAQPTFLQNALGGRTAYDYLAGRKRDDVLREAFQRAVAKLSTQAGNDPALWRYTPGAIRSTEPAVPYGNRGTFLQIVELRPLPRGRTVAPPGVAESGPHSNDQTPLAEGWRYKPIAIRP
ncbi:MAG: penicillin acylase family protein [Fimbriimonadales bacterium]|nr:penicillin acylase family protein [Fimbriimonadales bacterium]